jgi:hypothetical protein
MFDLGICEINFKIKKNLTKNSFQINILHTYEMLVLIESNASTANEQFDNNVHKNISTPKCVWNEDNGYW